MGIPDELMLLEFRNNCVFSFVIKNRILTISDTQLAWFSLIARTCQRTEPNTCNLVGCYRRKKYDYVLLYSSNLWSHIRGPIAPLCPPIDGQTRYDPILTGTAYEAGRTKIVHSRVKQEKTTILFRRRNIRNIYNNSYRVRYLKPVNGTMPRQCTRTSEIASHDRQLAWAFTTF